MWIKYNKTLCQKDCVFKLLYFALLNTIQLFFGKMFNYLLSTLINNALKTIFNDISAQTDVPNLLSLWNCLFPMTWKKNISDLLKVNYLAKQNFLTYIFKQRNGLKMQLNHAKP